MSWPELPWLLPWWGLIWFAIYWVTAFWFEDAFVISSYRMYSPTADRDHGAMPTFRVEGVQARLIDYHRFSGIDPVQVHWGEYACSHQWMVHEARRWIEEHPDDGSGGPTVEVDWGFRIFRVSPEGHVSDDYVPIVRGRAAKR